MKINHAILHVFDFVSCVNVYAQEELDLSSKNAKRYVTSHAKKALGNIDSKRGEFAALKARRLPCPKPSISILFPNVQIGRASCRERV